MILQWRSAGVPTRVWGQKCCYCISLKQLRVDGEPSRGKEGFKFHYKYLPLRLFFFFLSNIQFASLIVEKP